MTESFQALSALNTAKPRLLFLSQAQETPAEQGPGLSCITITRTNDANISRTANYGLYLIAAAARQWY
jgi:hypothetical protein